MSRRKIIRRVGSEKVIVSMPSISEDKASTDDPSSLPVDDNPEDDGEDTPLVDTVARMMVREKTFLTQVDEEKQDSRRNSDFDDSEDSDNEVASDDVSIYDADHDNDVRWRSRRKKLSFDIDADFNFDEDDEEEIRKRSKKKKITTEVVYTKACEKCRLPPCGVFTDQISKVTVSLRGLHLGPKEVKPIAISLVKDRNIVVLDMSDNNMGPVGIMYIAEMMQANTYLLELNLSGTNPGRDGLGALAETLRLNNSIRVLKLEENVIDHNDAPQIASIMKTCPKLQDLYLGHNKLGATGGKVIADALVKSSGLRTLDLQWNQLRRESAVEIGKALAKNKGLRLLNVAWNGFGKEGCLALAKSLPINTTLEELDLTCNRIDYLSLGFLAHGLFLNKHLKVVKVGHNPMTTDGAKDLLKTLKESKDSKLRELGLDDIAVDGEFVNMVSKVQTTLPLKVTYGHVMKLGTNMKSRDNDGKDLSKWDPVLVLFEYMRMDNLRLIDMFKSFDAKKRDKLSRGDVKAGINTLKIPFTEHSLDEIMEKLDTNKDGMIDLEEMMRGSKEMSRYVNQRTLKAKARKREDQGLITLRATLKSIIKKRKEEQDQAAANASKNRRKSMMAATGLHDFASVVRRVQQKQAKERVLVDSDGKEIKDVGGIVKLAAMKFRRKLVRQEHPVAIREETTLVAQDSSSEITI